MQLTDFLAVLRRSWVALLACTIIGGSLGVAHALTTAARYDATIQLYVSVQGTGAAADLAQSSSFARQAVASYVDVVTTSLVLAPVIEQFDLEVTPRELGRRIAASSPLNSQVIEITVSDESPSRAAQLANAVGESLAVAVATELERPTGSSEESKVGVETLSAATVPTTPSAPNTPLSVALGLIAGLVTGVIVAILRVVLDNRIHTTKDVEGVLERPVVGGIIFDASAAERPLIVHASPRDPRAEAFRRLRTNLDFLALTARDGGATPTFVFTSAGPAEGKSTTTANTALALAETGARVALVDADLRKPRVADLFAVEGGVGLSDVLAGRVPLSSAVQQWGRGHLFLLPAGTLPPNPAELLGSPAMARTLGELGAAFDYVLIDAPPLLAVTDAAVAARSTTGAIMIAASGSTRKNHLESAAKALATADANLLGAVVTKLPTRGPDSYGYGQYTYGVTHAQ